MQTSEQLKELVKQKYGEIASQSRSENAASCCGSGCCSDEVTQIMADDYSTLEGYQPDADLGLGCGLPTRFAHIREGDVVIDLGSGAGNDAFIARRETGASGQVIGIDFTPAMIEKARANAATLGFDNVRFIQGDIERMPVPDQTADVVVSNCVLNLVPDKAAVLSEIYRVLKPGGHFSISDVVLDGELPPALRNAAEMYAGCVSGALQKSVWLDLIGASGFKSISVQQEKKVHIPEDILRNFLSEAEICAFHSGPTGISSVTVYAEKPASSRSCCGPDCCS